VAAQQNQKPVAINLLSQDEFSQSAVGRVMLWALSIGRYVVVFTELIVIMSFLSRFKLDRDLTDLNEAINRQKAIILSYGTLETDFRFAQKQLEIIRASQSLISPPKILNLLSQTTPTDVKVEQFQLTEKGLQLSATALSPQGFVRFISNLLGNPTVKHLAIGGVNSKDKGLSISFDITAEITQ
jgi:hypothetical protein